jgi:hypothetical protein
LPSGSSRKRRSSRDCLRRFSGTFQILAAGEVGQQPAEARSGDLPVGRLHPAGVRAVSQRSILTGKQSLLLTHTAATESALLCGRMKRLSAFVELERQVLTMTFYLESMQSITHRAAHSFRSGEVRIFDSTGNVECHSVRRRESKAVKHCPDGLHRIALESFLITGR